ncbi:MAG: peptidoglycan-binding domain-containing protein [Desulfobaccales bacterium]|nr:peptidoglycan-binding domain-containing protein [Desulfobaccales bacterium]
MSTGKEIFALAIWHLGEDYVLGALAPKNKANWRGPWDCAEFVTWCVFQASGILYGCQDDRADPAVADAYTGYWARDAARLGKKISVAEAARTPGAALLRVGPKMGHIVISDGRGGTVEAHSANDGVIISTLLGRRWDMGILVPGIQYRPLTGAVKVPPPAILYRLTSPPQKGDQVRRVQEKLKEQGFDPQGADGIYGPKTFAAVLAFQRARGLLPDGEVGPQTAKALGMTLS